MSFIRSTALRASSVARAARPARYIRSAELQQPWQRAVQRRTYASSGGSHGEAKSNDLPWAASAVASTLLGTYIVWTQDLGHGGGDHGDHGDHHEEHEEAAPTEEAKSETEDEQSKEEEKKDEEKVEENKEEKKEEKKSDSKDPAESDKADVSKEPKSSNEQSGKQEGLSNADTKHSDDTSEQSTKGEGVHETAKVKGTVDTKRPQK